MKIEFNQYVTNYEGSCFINLRKQVSLSSSISYPGTVQVHLNLPGEFSQACSHGPVPLLISHSSKSGQTKECLLQAWVVTFFPVFFFFSVS